MGSLGTAALIGILLAFVWTAFSDFMRELRIQKFLAEKRAEDDRIKKTELEYEQWKKQRGL